MKPVLVIGAGGHANVVADALLASGRQILGFIVGTSAEDARRGSSLSLDILGDDGYLNKFSPKETDLVNGIGGVDCRGLRRRVQERLESEGWHFCSVRHPAALVSRFAELSSGVQLLAGSVVQAGVKVGAGSIVNTAAVLEHDSVLGKFVHIAPRALLCGNTIVGCNSHVGAGAVVIQGVSLGAQTLVGAGAVVVDSFPGGATLVGLPARYLSTSREKKGV